MYQLCSLGYTNLAAMKYDNILSNRWFSFYIHAATQKITIS